MVKMKRIIYAISNYLLLLLLIFAATSCSSEYSIPELSSVESDTMEIKGVPTYISKIGEIVKHEETRSVTEEQTETVPSLIKASIDFLHVNNIDYKEFFNNDSDPRIVVYAIAIVELQKTETMQPTTRTSLGGCVLEGLGIRGLATGKAAVKAIGKVLAKRAIPYIGWGLFAIDMAMCLAE